MADDYDSCVFLLKTFDDIGVDAYEINVSCSHSGAVHGNLNVDFEHLERLMKAAREATKTPIWIKLSYSHVLLSMAKTAEYLGADAIVCSNSIGLIDTETALPKLGIMGGAGGVTGEAIFPIALNCVYMLTSQLDIPIVGVGGIFTADQAIQMMMAGASAVQLYTAPALHGAIVFEKIAMGIKSFIEKSDCASLGKAKAHCFNAPKPTVVDFPDNCTHCLACQTACNFGAIFRSPQFDKFVPRIDYMHCVGCTACVGVCPRHIIKVSYERS